MRQHLSEGPIRLFCRLLPAGCLLAAGFVFFLAMTAATPGDVLAQATSPPSGATATSESERRDLEQKKLQREIDKLEVELGTLSSALRVVSVAIPVLAVVLSVWGGFVLNSRLDKHREAARLLEERRQTTEERAAKQFSALIEDRARSYAQAYEHLNPTAIYFRRFDAEPNASDPSSDALGLAESRLAPSQSGAPKPTQSRSQESLQLTKDDCVRMGGQLSSWYFSAGGLLMTEASRDSYFTLMEALRRAATAPGELAVQTVGQHAQRISLTMITDYRQRLAKKPYPIFEKLEAKQPIKPADLDRWEFGQMAMGDDAEQFKDFVLIQALASRFRTSLTDDIGSRKPPASSRAERYSEEPGDD